MGIFSFLFGHKGTNTNVPPVLPDKYWEAIVESDRYVEKLRQGLEDDRVRLYIKFEAQRLFNEWEAAEWIEHEGKRFKNHMFLVKPYFDMYYIYDEETAAFKELTSFDDLVFEEFDKLKSKYECGMPYRKCSDCGTEYYSHQRCPECSPMG